MVGSIDFGVEEVIAFCAKVEGRHGAKRCKVGCWKWWRWRCRMEDEMRTGRSRAGEGSAESTDATWLSGIDTTLRKKCRL